jgi:hypothetical protein
VRRRLAGAWEWTNGIGGTDGKMAWCSGAKGGSGGHWVTFMPCESWVGERKMEGGGVPSIATGEVRGLEAGSVAWAQSGGQWR